MSTRGLTVARLGIAEINSSLDVLDGLTQNLSAKGQIGTSNVTGISFYAVQLSPADVAANTTAEQTFTVNGLLPGSVVVVNKPTAQAGLGIVGARVASASSLGITFSNNTGSPITPTASEPYLVVALLGA